MLNDEELERFLISKQVPLEARKVIQHIRGSAPSRRTESSKRSVAVRFASRKMQVIIQAESHNNELAAVYHWEHDSSVHEFYDQPPPIPLRYTTADGRPTGASHTPDYFLIAEVFLGWVECKTEEQLEKLAERQPGRYVKDEDGRWRCPPGEEYASQYGLQYALRSSSENDWVLIRNLNFLEDYLLPNCPVPTAAHHAVAKALFREQPWMRLSDLLKADSTLPADAVYKLIADGDLYFDFTGALISQLDSARVFRDVVASEVYRLAVSGDRERRSEGPLPVDLRPGSSVVLDGNVWQILSEGKEDIHLADSNGNYTKIKTVLVERLAREGGITGLPQEAESATQRIIEQRLRSASPLDLELAAKRHHVLFPPAGEAPPNTPARTLRQYRRAFRDAERALGCGFIGLLPRVSQRGNRNRKVDSHVLALINELVEQRYANAKRESLVSLWGDLLLSCRELGLAKISKKSFYCEVRRLRTHRLEAQRVGDKAAYGLQEFCWVLEIGTPRHGERPFEIAHVDHTEMDVMLVHPLTGVDLGRPWLTLLIDAFTRKALAWVISFSRPNAITCMMIIRECVRRHGRVPKTLVVDGGAEFKSTYFECLLALLSITKKTRPPSKGRFGSVMERMFGTTNRQFIHDLAGNTKGTRDPRSLSSTHDPKRHAVWDLRALTDRFAAWVEECYHERIHAALGTSPSKFMAAMTAVTGERSHTLIPYTEGFVISCMPATPGKGTLSVDQARGVKTQARRYWHPSLGDPALNGKELPARTDPFNLFHVYVFVKGRWVECVADNTAEFRFMDDHDKRIVSEEIVALLAREGEIAESNAMDQAAFNRKTRELEAKLAEHRQAMRAQSGAEPEQANAPSFDSAWDPRLDHLCETTYGDF